MVKFEESLKNIKMVAKYATVCMIFVILFLQIFVILKINRMADMLGKLNAAQPEQQPDTPDQGQTTQAET